jgi:putative transposase
MAQSLASLHIHLVFSTKNRITIIHDHIRDPLHRYMSAVISEMGCHADIINSVEDHVHIMFDLGRTNPVCKIVEEVKKSSSKWIKTQGAHFEVFSWQAGYAAYAVSALDV